MRTYADFARLSPIPEREDGLATTPRNSPSLVGITRGSPRRSLFHFDGEFPSLPDLVTATLTGRNFGWLPSEFDQAVRHIATVIREDDGTGALARGFGGSYRRVFLGGPGVPEELRLPTALRLDVIDASDDAILQLVAKLIAAYVHSLAFLEEHGVFDGAPFDIFLEHNGLPRSPAQGQSALAYSREIRRRLAGRRNVALVRPDGPRTFAFHDQPFRFGQEELRGLRIFLREPGSGGATTGVGNCIACHPLPTFSDVRAHNTGVSQRGYDAAHGAGSFAALPIPDLTTRNAAFDTYLPATPAHPDAAGPFRREAAAEAPGATDLGLWNALANPDLPSAGHQRRLSRVACRSRGKAACRAMRNDQAQLLDASVGLFKTPGLRDLGHSTPYLHDGSADTLEDVVSFYVEASALARNGQLRNAAPELLDIHLGPDDVAPLAAFLRALNEDYE
jgi:cytochrome c peroxidase